MIDVAIVPMLQCGLFARISPYPSSYLRRSTGSVGCAVNLNPHSDHTLACAQSRRAAAPIGLTTVVREGLVGLRHPMVSSRFFTAEPRLFTASSTHWTNDPASYAPALAAASMIQRIASAGAAPSGLRPALIRAPPTRRSGPRRPLHVVQASWNIRIGSVRFRPDASARPGVVDDTSAADFLPSYISAFMKRLRTTSPNFASGRIRACRPVTTRHAIAPYFGRFAPYSDRADDASASPGYPGRHAGCDTERPEDLHASPRSAPPSAPADCGLTRM